MELIFATECRFEKCLDGKIYSPDGTVRAQSWSRYLSSFDKIIILGRVLHSQKACYHHDFLAESDKVSFIELPNYVGPAKYLGKKKEIENIIKIEAIPNRAYICRVPGEIGRLLATQLHKRGIPYAVEVVGDPWDVFAPGVVKHPLRPFIRVFSYQSLKKVVYRASASLYVTKKKLQKRYPYAKNTFSTYASDVLLPEQDNSIISKVFNKTKDSEIKIISIGSLAQMYKAPDIVLKSLKILKDRGWNCQLNWIGEGKYKDAMIKFGKELGLSENVSFVGSVSSGDGVRNLLLDSDLFLLVSHTEGLPRAIIEAMSVGLPCIGSRVGGIPELLEEIALVEPDNARQLANKIEQFISDKNLMNSEALRNLLESANYFDCVLQNRRKAFYEEIIHISK